MDTDSTSTLSSFSIVILVFVAAYAVPDGGVLAQGLSMCADRTINGTSVRECYDGAQGEAVLTNSCGTQRMSAQALSNGAIPSDIVPCPRSGGGNSSSNNGGGSNHDFYYQLASSQMQQGSNSVRNKDYTMAAAQYQGAEQQYRELGDGRNAAIAAHAKRQSRCWAGMSAYNDQPLLLRVLRGEHPENTMMFAFGDESDQGVCREFPDAMNWLNNHINSVEAQQRAAEVQQRAAVTKLRAEQDQREYEKQLQDKVNEALDVNPPNDPVQNHAAEHKLTEALNAEPPKPKITIVPVRPRMTSVGPQASGPIVDASSLRAQQGSCSDLTGVGGGPGPSNCNASNGIPPALQSQIAQARANAEGNSRDSLQSAAEQYRQIEAELMAAGDLANAAIAAEEALALEGLLAGSPSTNSCPAAGPINSDYCKHANCFERGTAYYGMLCFPIDCAAKLKTLDGRNLPKAEIENLMGRGSPRCSADGIAMTPREMMMFDKRHHKNWGTSAAEGD
jgi:hypothetical protein